MDARCKTCLKTVEAASFGERVVIQEEGCNECVGRNEEAKVRARVAQKRHDMQTFALLEREMEGLEI